jgi:putative ABC transport system permease protein
MFRNYLKVAWRNILRDKVYSSINIGGLAIGMVVAGLIGLWIRDEMTMNQQHANYDRLAQVMQHASVDGTIVTFSSLPMPTSAAIRDAYGEDFASVASTWVGERTVTYKEKVLLQTGCFAEAPFPGMITLDMIRGTTAGLNDPSAIFLSESLATSLFGTTDPIGQTVMIDYANAQQVKGIYKDLPANSSFSGLAFIAPIKLLFASGQNMDNWYSSSFHIFAQLTTKGDFKKSSEKIKNILYEHSEDATKPVLFLNPMSRWHLYEFRNGISVNGRMQFVWLFGIIGSFVLLLACINFMNLSTARSEKRAKEVGIRKAIGSLKQQLVGQFLCESFLVVVIGAGLAIVLATLCLPFFNTFSGKKMDIPWTQPGLWFVIAAFIFIVGLLAGSYPAFYLSSFRPIRALKGSLTAGRFASVPRQVMVVVQFTVSVVLVIGTLVVYDQIQFAKNRPVGYSREGLVTVNQITNEIREHYEAFHRELLATNAVTGVSMASTSTTSINSSADNLDWSGKDPNTQSLFGTISIDQDYGDVVDWKLIAGRNFSRELASDSQAFIFNKAAIVQMGLKEPVGETIKWHGKNWHIIGVINDMVMTSPFGTAMPTVFMIDSRERPYNVMNLKLNPETGTGEALAKIETVFKKYSPAAPFDYRFADQEYGLKFAAEERVGKLASIFAVLAITISCLGLFGLASFITEQRTKEIGIRKVLGASVTHLWQMLSRDFMVLVVISCFIAVPVAWRLMDQWLQAYDYKTEISWQVFLVAIATAVVVTLVTISYQVVKAALADPVKSLRSE